jgi:hypothetical protein
MRQEKLKVVNLFGAPGVGKSATRSGVFWLMKVKGMGVEEVSEFAKYLVLAKRTWQLKEDQLYVLAQQHHKMLILKGEYEFAVTDSPLMLAGYYCEENWRDDRAAGREPGAPKSFVGLCRDYAEGFDNLNLFLTRDFSKQAFENRGRLHGIEESVRIDREQKEFLRREGQEWIDVELDELAPWRVLGHVEGKWPGTVPSWGPREPSVEERP